MAGCWVDTRVEASGSNLREMNDMFTPPHSILLPHIHEKHLYHFLLLHVKLSYETKGSVTQLNSSTVEAQNRNKSETEIRQTPW